ncbi:NAD(P)/FAD-dependent oxidoreductase [soil metagenome]
MTETYDVVVIGSGPNGLAAAIAMLRAGLSVHVIEAHATPGGGMRTTNLTLEGFEHDVCSSVHPLGIASPWFRAIKLEDHGLGWIHPSAPLAHVMGDGHAVMLERSLAATAAGLGEDGHAYTELMQPFVDELDELFPDILGPLRFPEHPVRLARFGLEAIRSMRGLAESRFTGQAARALLGGIAAHAMIPLGDVATASFGLVLALAGHGSGWPIARGGSRAICDALVAHLIALGGTLELGHQISGYDELPLARAYLFDTDPRQLEAICGDRLPAHYRARLERFRYGPGVFKLDWALAEPVPWRDPACRRAGTVHLSGTLDDILRAQAIVHEGKTGDRPFILFGQPSLFDPTRAPAGKHTAWAYCHVPSNSDVDMTAVIEARIEEFAPGFRDIILARASANPRQLAAYNPNCVGGDINGGLSDWRQLFFRPVASADPYATGAPEIFLCSASTPPGGGVHGMCGYFAAASALHHVFGLAPPPLT